MKLPGSDIDPLKPSTWPQPVSEHWERTDLVRKLTVEYTVPLCPNTLAMAMMNLPLDVPPGPVTYPKIWLSRSNVVRDGGHKAGFFVEFVWPLVDLSKLPVDSPDGDGEQPIPTRRRRDSTVRKPRST